MPVIGSFHDKYWRARANEPPEVVAGTGGVYPQYQNTVHRAVSLSSAIWWLPCDALEPWIDHLRWSWRLVRRLWQWRAPAQRARLEMWITRLETLDPERDAVVERVLTALYQPEWLEARRGVRACATTPKFHQPEQWLAYSRALKANIGQAQNVFRHIKVVQELKQAHPDLSNPDAHLLTELAYHGYAAMGRDGRKVVTH